MSQGSGLAVEAAPGGWCAGAGPAPAKSQRDLRVDALRGVALLMIAVDHVPKNALNLITLHNFGFADAAELFVLLAGFSSMIAYGGIIGRDGLVRGLARIAARCARIYVTHIGLVCLTILVVWKWTGHFHQKPLAMAPILAAGPAGFWRAMTLQALPGYLDILPLYIVLLAMFPLIYLVMRRSVALALALSGAVWLAANANDAINLPNWIDGNGWYFNPFTWQFLFTIGAALSVFMRAWDGIVPRRRWLVIACCLYLAFAFVQGAPWADWGLQEIRLFPMTMPDKSHLSPLRIINIMALMYLLLSSRRVAQAVEWRIGRVVILLGRHSLEVFATGCVVALFGRLLFRTFGATVWLQAGVDIAAFAAMWGIAKTMERRRPRSGRPSGRIDGVGADAVAR